MGPKGGNMESSDITFLVKGGTQMPLLKHAGTGGQSFPYLYFPLLEGTGMVKHCFTTRLGGVSKGCFRGLYVKGDTESIGLETTKSVVNALFWVILINAIFSVITTRLNI